MTNTPLSAAEWAEARALFELLVDLPEADHGQVLAESGASARVLHEVRALLHHAGPTHNGFLAQPADPLRAGAPAAATRPADRIGEQLGPWRITGLLGRGGMGEVWAAERADGAFDGRVAVKVLKRGMDSQRVLDRFAQEQRALARLQHPHIAHLIDAGRTADGLPYFVMEAVDGLPIDQACHGLPLERRLALFLQLADAVAHAHRQLLLHRDLKPSNVLVNADGQVKLLDFGIAKALDPLDGHSGEVTVAGERPFTPQFASPEQVRGEPVGTATDIYSLGVLLYILLTGLRPYGREATTAREAARCVLEESPTRPSALSPGLVADPQWLATRRRLAGDLDKVLLKALDKQVDGRYPSVDALAADIRAFLAGFPVSARPASWRYRARKFVGRHRALALASALGTVALLVGVSATLWQAREADLARQAAEAARAQAEQRFAQLRQLANRLVFQYHDQIETLPGAQKVREALLTDAAGYLDGLRQAALTDPGLAEELAATYYRIAQLQGVDLSINTGQFSQAEATLKEAIALQPLYTARAGVTQKALSIAVSMHVHMGELLQRQGRMAQAEAALRAGLPLLERGLARDPRDSWALAAAVSLHGVHARLLGNDPSRAQLGRWRAACAAADQARQAAEASMAANPSNKFAPDTLAFTLGEQALCQATAGLPAAAAPLFERQITLRDQMAQALPDDQDFRWQRAVARAQLARVRGLQGDPGRGLSEMTEALALAGAAAAADTDNAAGQRRLAAMRLMQAELQRLAGQAEPARRNALALLAALPAVDAQAPFGERALRIEALLCAARASGAAGLQAEAKRLAAQALALATPPTGAAAASDDNAAVHWLRAQALGEQAAAAKALGRRPEASALAAQAEAAWDAAPAAESLPPLLQPWRDALAALR